MSRSCRNPGHALVFFAYCLWSNPLWAQSPVFEDTLINTSKLSGQYGWGGFSTNGYTLSHYNYYTQCEGNVPRSRDFVYYNFNATTYGQGSSWTQGSFEFDVTGLASSSGISDNELMLSGESYNQPDPVYNGFSYNSPYWVHLRKHHFDACTGLQSYNNKLKVHAEGPDYQVVENWTNQLTWDAATTYRFRICWSNNQLKVYRGLPGQTLTLMSPPTPYTFAGLWSPVTLHIQLGSTYFAGPLNYAPSGGTPGTVYSLLRVYGTDIGAQATLVRSGSSLAFTDITSSSGTGGPQNGGEYGGHGVEWADVTGDGRPDFYVTMNHNISMAELFYRNINGSSFVEEAAARGIANYDTGSHGGVWADLDNDGDYDLVNGAYVRNRAYENDGSGYFTDRTTTCGFLNVNRGTRGTLAFDYDKDGDLDVFCNNWEPDSEANEFYRNDGNWQFTSITNNGLGGSTLGAQGATEGDFDNDGDLDVLLCRWGSGPLLLMRNDNGTFTQLSLFGSTSPHQDGATFVDVNNDGWLDVHSMYSTYLGIGTTRLFINNKNGTFTEVSVADGPGFMAGFEDLDNDGDWDMVYPGDNKVYLNDGTGTFTAAASFNPGTDMTKDPRCVAFADIDNDGDMDFFYAQKQYYNRMIRNDLSGGGNWLKIKLAGENGQAGAFGAKVKTYDAGYAGQAAHLISFREARSNEGYLGQNEPVLHFGLGSRTTVDVQVTYLVSGNTVTFSNVAVNQTLGTQPEAPVINEVTPDPGSAASGVPYVKQLTLAQGSPYPTWSVISGPSGLQVSSTGLVSGWTPSSALAGQLITITIRATNSQGYDDETWQVIVLVPLAQHGFDSDADGWTLATWKAGSYDLGTMAWDSASGNSGGNVKSTGSGSTNNDDSCTREGGLMTKAISTANFEDIHIAYDVIATLNTPPSAGCTTPCLSSVLEGSCEDKLAVYYSTAGTSGPWTLAQVLTEGVDLPNAWTNKLINLSGVSAAQDNANFAVRFVWQFNTATDTGRIDNVKILGSPMGGLPPAKASNPNPLHQATNVGRDADLSWTAGDGAVSHDVYFGATSPPVFQGNQTGTTFDPGQMNRAQTYYWRIDARNDAGVTTGDVWQFTVQAAPGDFDADGDVDLTDFGYLQRCYSGSGVPPAGGCTDADLGGDNDVDQDDFQIFRNCLGGSNQSSGC